MNSKKHLFNEAERLYTNEYLTVDELADRLCLNRKTILSWKEQGDWDTKRRELLKSKQSFHQELYEFARNLMDGISADLRAGTKVDPGRMYAFCKIIPMFTKVKNYEDLVSSNNKKTSPRGLTPELIAQIEEEVLGITPNVDSEEVEEK